MGGQLRIIHLESHVKDATLIEATLLGSGIECEISLVQTRDAFVHQLKEGRYDMILSDYALPGFDGMSALKLAIDLRGSAVPFLFVSGTSGEEIAVEAIRNGAVDFVLKNRLDRLPQAVRRALNKLDDRCAGCRTRLALQESEKRFRTLTEAMPQIVWTFTSDGEVDYCNAKWEESTGLPPEASHGSGWRSVLHSDDLINVVNAWERLVQTGEPVGIEHRIRQRDGSYRWFLTKVLPLRDDHQCVTKWLGSSTDIHDQKMAQEQLTNINELLEERAIQRTRSLVEHQEQLRAMASDLTLTEQRERRRLAGELHDYLAQLLVACKMKARLLVPTIQTPRGQSLVAEVNDLLEQSLKYTRTLIAELSPTILYEVGLPAAVRWLGEQMERHGLTVEIQQDDDITTMPDDQAVLVFEAIRELLINAAKHAMVHKASVRLERIAPNRMKITVADEGAGFDVATMEGPAVVGKHGLFTIQERLEVLGGRFEIDSAPGLGTRATLTVPMEAAKAQPEAAAEIPVTSTPQSMPNLGRSTHRRITRVLLADDHNMVREGLRNLIENEPRLRVVGEAANGEEAILQARNLHPDVIVMDINMPKINGIEATRRIREELPFVAVVALSMHDDKSMIAAMKEAGAVTYIPKSGVSEDLSRAIREAHISVVAAADMSGGISDDAAG